MSSHNGKVLGLDGTGGVRMKEHARGEDCWWRWEGETICNKQSGTALDLARNPGPSSTA